MPTGEQLKALLRRYSVTRETAARLIHATPSQFNDWCLPADSNSYRPMPEASWELLKIKLLTYKP